MPTFLLQTCEVMLEAPQKCLQKCILLPLPGEVGAGLFLP